MSEPIHPAARTAIVIVTHRRPALLADLLASVEAMTAVPQDVIVVDNASNDGSEDIVRNAADRIANLTYVQLPENTGGSGGFMVGMQAALELGAEWVWMMDDDVMVYPDALIDLMHYTDRYETIIGRRHNADGSTYFFQNFFVESLGIHLPRPGNIFERSDVWETNLSTFEGLFISAKRVAEIGLPDPRFFITWDDVVYGWLASQRGPVACVDKFVMQRVRRQRQISLGIRHLSDSSDLSRRYVMRNRGHVARYLRQDNRYSPILFAMGTGLTLAKELVRLLLVERSLKGWSALRQGMEEARTIMQDPAWKPMPPLHVAASDATASSADEKTAGNRRPRHQ
ncbi:hypothetical protein WH87_10270 [Devosia epidermidihirudinis]|uniref:Glycosyltransferase 2-like domain-containing protein n=1 Tax=Devosia epidermidihirudinis TaxID=1293439 RepID=A0A0F5QAL3_9HYPH|nr:glycosyltransferase [Devosia epidermidihirudinis]KKC38010.1 hypothetical protein WH87_10270 [Devosia epidermidihirudinis]